MKIEVKFGRPPTNINAVQVHLFAKSDSGSVAKAAADLGLSKVLPGKSDFTGRRDESFECYLQKDARGLHHIFLGIGTDADGGADNARRAGGILAGIAAKSKDQAAILLDCPEPAKNLAAFAEGLILGGYRFDRFKSRQSNKSENNKIKKLRLYLGDKFKAHIRAVDRSVIVAEAACLARDLVNTPANYLTPTSYANEAAALAGKYRIKMKIYGPRELAKLKMGLLLGVARGSDQPPRLITWRYDGGKKGEPPIVLVGKGVTFDTGGISLKPNEGMADMKNDMAGSAAVIAQIMVLGRLKPRLNVIGVAPAVENMPSGKALKPSDILTASDGQTVEVLNTDAEGRLILADALCFAQRFKPKAIIDIATLTGAVKIALGTATAGILGNDEALLKRLYDCGQATAEKTWQLPLWREYYEQIKSDMADMKNVGGKPAGAITAAAFLSKFVKKVPWAHIDIAAMDNQEGSHPYQPKGATGFGVRLLAEMLLGWKG